MDIYAIHIFSFGLFSYVEQDVSNRATRHPLEQRKREPQKKLYTRSVD